MNNSKLPTDSIEYISVNISTNKIEWKSILTVINQSLISFFSAPFKFTVAFIIMVILYYLAAVLLMLEKLHEGLPILGGILVCIPMLFLYGFMTAIITRANNNKIKFKEFFKGFKNKPIDQIFLVLFPSLYLFLVGLLLVNVGVLDIVEDTFKYRYYDDLGWILALFAIKSLLLIPGILWFFFSIYLLVASENFEGNSEFNDLLLMPILAIKKNFFRLWLVLFVYILIFGFLIALAAPVAIYANAVFIALVVYLGKGIFSLEDKKEII